MNSKIIFDNLINISVRAWLKLNCSKINILTLKIITNNRSFGKIDELYIEATNLIYQNLYLNKVILKTYNCCLKFNYKNNLIYSENLTINGLLTIDDRNLNNLFFENKWKAIRIKIQDLLIEGGNILNLTIDNNYIILNYQKNNLNFETNILLNLIDNSIFLKNLKNKKEMLLPIDENIKFNKFDINGKLINIGLTSKVIFDI